ncbi:GXWXG domain-containing protein [Devosia sp. 1566]|uniref:DUF4334 domain-containing protein n=1 Tax=Devosia sp. 1566 TaxID=2499144 RepID=UPI000FD8B209|nr:GXWXG domain-containing protein [Devosia sp. 1566]
MLDTELWIASAQQEGSSLEAALDQFDRLPSPNLAEIIGRWRGVSIPTGHVLDGMLEAFQWYGKAFMDEERVFPLLFGNSSPVTLNPRFLPLNNATARLQRLGPVRLLFRLGYRALATDKPTARLRTLTCRGVPTMSMIYDRQPIIDSFRRVTPDLLLGMMDCRGFEPLFFALHRDKGGRVGAR